MSIFHFSVGEAGAAGVLAVRRVARGERYGPGSVKKTQALEGPSVQTWTGKNEAAEQQTAHWS